MESLRILTIEETYELADAIDSGNSKDVCEEVGDILLHLVFYARIAREKNEWDIAESINKLCEKLIHRHPHIYADVKVNGEEEVKANWEKLKLKEGKTSVLNGVPKSLPAVVKAYRIQEKAKQVKFEWENKEQVWEKVEEELKELAAEVTTMNDRQKVEEEFGDVLFSLVNYARFIGVDHEAALEKTKKKFISRFKLMEEMAKEKHLDLGEMTLAEMDLLWTETKKTFR